MHKSSFVAIRIVWVFAAAILSFYVGRAEADTILTGSSAFIIHEVNPDNWVQECATVFQETCCRSLGDMTNVNYSSYDILTKPSGLCKPEFSCAWGQCLPENYPKSYNGTLEFIKDFMALNITNDTTYSDIESELGPGLNLPKKISFPTQVADIVAAIQHAKQEGLTVSILATGHSYSGASTSADSVQLNLRNYPKYSKTSIVECDDAIIDETTNPDSAACKLVTARGKKALVRVGGGEIFNDTANSVFNLKNETTGYSRYLMLQGTGTVGAAGGWLQGGGLGWGQERVWGFGVDQVLELELVLANEQHVKLYPTEWDNAEGFLYPKTTKVEGLCNKNVGNDESMWKWEPCKDPIPPFDDLWFAVRGGGGGTYGVLTSLKYQLHDFIPFYSFGLNFTTYTALIEKVPTYLNTSSQEELTNFQGKLAYCFMQFSFGFLFNPEILNVTVDESNHCGHSELTPYFPNWNCLGEEALLASVKAYQTSIKLCSAEAFPKFPDLSSDLKLDQLYFTGGPYDSLLGFNNYDGGAQMDVPGQMGDDGPSILPQHLPYSSGWSSAQIPAEWLASDDKENFVETFLVNQANGGHVTGGKVSLASDQMNAVPVTERQSGLASSSLSYLPVDLQEKLLSIFLTMSGESEDFLGYNEYNHISSGSYGPLKSNMTKLCPEEYTAEEKDEQCYSMQESVWGVELTAKLENIKYAVDPDHLFECYGCISSRSSGSSNDVPSVPVDPPVKTPTFSNDDAATTTTIPSTTIPGADVDPKAVEESSSSSSRQYYVSSLLLFIDIAFIVGVWIFV